LLHSLRDRSVQGIRVQRICLQLGAGIPRCGADLIGYYSPHEGSSTVAYGVYNIGGLAEYEAYRERLRNDPLGQSNYEFAKKEQFIRLEDRIFLRRASTPHAELIHSS
jgi:hypothetical protein